MHTDVYETFATKFVAAAGALKIGPANSMTCDVGPLISEAAADRMQELVDDALANGARLALGGSRDAELGPSFYPPTVLLDVPSSAAVMKCEVFGTVVPIVRVEGVEEAVVAMNDSDFGWVQHCFLFHSLFSHASSSRCDENTILQAHSWGVLVEQGGRGKCLIAC